ncbi:mitochondrial matrix iron-sulfur protein [Microbotryomycetes sp. JL221]|nr:mitochondrial matrix iron-sulfur protein [Microbotryomycetes sp. JL221]
MLRHCMARAASAAAVAPSSSKLSQQSCHKLAKTLRSSLAETWSRPSQPSSHRLLSTTAPRSHGGKGRPAEGKGITLHFKRSNGEIETVQANEGDDIVDVSWEYDLDIEAACEKSVACSTCHVILEEDVYDKLEEPSDDENDMLDLAFGLTDTSRLGCQIKVEKWMDGTTITLPSATRNLRVDGSKPSHH